MVEEIRLEDRPKEAETEEKLLAKEGLDGTEAGPSETHTLEDILKSVGGLGRWQMTNLLVIGWVMLLLGAINMFIVFLQVSPKFVCADNVPLLGPNWTFHNIR